MNIKRTTINFCVLLILLALIQPAMAQYSVGDTVSNFTIEDLDGNSVSLFNHKGKIILLNFFATW